MKGIRYNILFISLFLLLLIQSADSLPPTRSSMPYRHALSTEIAFWKMVFTRYSQDDYILHDSEYLNIIYKIVSFDSSYSERMREKKIKAFKKEIKKLLLQFHSGEFERSHLTAWERNVYDQFKKMPGKHKFLKAARRIRAQQGIKENFLSGVTRSYAYLPYLKEVFREEGLPLELIYLPHVESSFNPNAVSHVGAVGMWQFMRTTARPLMKVNGVKDERFDPLISTRAAARLLKYNYRVLKDWALAITAYNHGLAGMKRAKRRYGNYLQIRDRYLRRSFGFASKNFYPEFLAVIDIMDSLDYFFPEIKKDSLFRFQEITLPVAIKIPEFVRQFQFDLHELKRLNPGFRIRVWRGTRKIPAGYTLRLPPETDAPRILAELQSLRKRKPPVQLASTLQPTTDGAMPSEPTSSPTARGPVQFAHARPNVDPDLSSFVPHSRDGWIPFESDYSPMEFSDITLNNTHMFADSRWLPKHDVKNEEEIVPGKGAPSAQGERALQYLPYDVAYIFPLSEDVRSEASRKPERISDNTVANRSEEIGWAFWESPLPPLAIDINPVLFADETLSPLPGTEAETVLYAITTLPGRDSAIPLNIDEIPGNNASPRKKDTPSNRVRKLPGVETDEPFASFFEMDKLAEAVLFAVPDADFFDFRIDRPVNPEPLRRDSLQQYLPIEPHFLLVEEYRPGKGLASRSDARFAKPAVNDDSIIETLASDNMLLLSAQVGFADSSYPLLFAGQSIPTLFAELSKPGVEADHPELRKTGIPRQPLAFQSEPSLAELDNLRGGYSGYHSQPQPGSILFSAWAPSREIAEKGVLSYAEIVLMLKNKLRVKRGRIVVFPDETIGHISEWLKISASHLRRINHLSHSNTIFTGQELLLDFSRVTPSEFFEKRLQYHLSLLGNYLQGSSGIRLIQHRVKTGDNLWKLAHRTYKFPVNLLLYFNDFDKLERLYPGDVVYLPIKYN